MLPSPLLRASKNSLRRLNLSLKRGVGTGKFSRKVLAHEVCVKYFKVKIKLIYSRDYFGEYDMDFKYEIIESKETDYWEDI